MNNTKSQLIKIAKRENNNKRNYLVVNPLQGKHMPVSPSQSLNLFHKLANLLRDSYQKQSVSEAMESIVGRVLCVGFAETATAIGAAVAIDLGAKYIQTTRESLNDVEYLYFTEAHSHATEQKLVKADIDTCVIEQVNHIIFVEDEITTGNTILNLVDALEALYPRQFRFSVASLLNGMDEASTKRFDKRDIALYYLVKTNHNEYSSIAAQYEADGIYHLAKQNEHEVNLNLSRLEMFGWKNTRRLVEATEYERTCGLLWKQVLESVDFTEIEKVLVLGTEEFMYPALYVGSQIEKLGKKRNQCLQELERTKKMEVKCHATTRSPIVVSKAKDYPLHERYELRSMYDSERKIFVYDIGVYDMVLVLTDAWQGQIVGENTLIHALREAGNQNMFLIRWCEG
ncbi:MAG: phosphoribosyltransferase domain-containing protein [Lachnospiraceae bacterium]